MLRKNATIRQAKVHEIPDILRLTSSCASHLASRGIYQWNEHYPSEASFLRDVDREELFVTVQGNTILGTIVISTEMDEVYQAVAWLVPNDHNIYIHRLSVHPDHQGRGYARQMMDFAEDLAVRGGYRSIRLDTFSRNRRNQMFYEIRGYQRLGDVYFPKQSPYPFHCYERVL